jgi:uncharacterized repeat protein (TIGR03803 family)
MNKTRSFRFAAFLCFATLLALAGCGGGSGSSPGGSYSIGGTVSNLPANATVTVVNNGGDALTISASGTFKFASNVASGAAYAVTVQSHTPGVGCDVGSGSGTVGSSAVTGVTVTCRAGAVSLLHSFDVTAGSVDGQYPTAGLVRDTAGNFYGTTQLGGLYGSACSSYPIDGCGTVFKISASGVYSTLYKFGSTTGDGLNPNAALIIDGANNLYGTTTLGGANNTGTVFKISPSGTQTVLYPFGVAAGGDGQSPYGSLAFDGSGNLYGTTSQGGANSSGAVFKITFTGSSVAESVIYSFGFAPGDGQSPIGGLLIDSGGTIYGTTSVGGGGSTGSGTVFKISAGGTYSDLYVFGSNAGDGLSPYGNLVMDSAGNLYGTTYSGGANNLGTVFQVTPAGVLTVLYSFTGGTDGQQPYAGLVADSGGNLYGTTSFGGNNNAGSLFRITMAGAFTNLYTFNGSTGSVDGQQSQGGLVIDSAGNIYGTTTAGGATGGGTVYKLD